MDTELKPCPFCGADEDLRVVSVYGEERYVTCLTCSACGPDAETADEAIEAWNRRAGEG